jgi:hypothetical protein
VKELKVMFARRILGVTVLALIIGTPAHSQTPGLCRRVRRSARIADMRSEGATRFGFCVLRIDRAARRTVLAAMPCQAMAT